MFYRTTYLSPVGLLHLAAYDQSLIGLWIEGEKYFDQSHFSTMKANDNIDIFKQTKTWLDHYFSGKKPDIKKLALNPSGSDFRQGVWQMLSEIPYGTLITYGEIAKKIAQKNNITSMSSQAVGGAVGHNPISIIIPCHRVVGQQGNLTGYAGGIEKKIKLLELEGINISTLFTPVKGTAL